MFRATGRRGGGVVVVAVATARASAAAAARAIVRPCSQKQNNRPTRPRCFRCVGTTATTSMAANWTKPVALRIRNEASSSSSSSPYYSPPFLPQHRRQRQRTRLFATAGTGRGGGCGGGRDDIDDDDERSSLLTVAAAQRQLPRAADDGDDRGAGDGLRLRAEEQRQREAGRILDGMLATQTTTTEEEEEETPVVDHELALRLLERLLLEGDCSRAGASAALNRILEDWYRAWKATTTTSKKRQQPQLLTPQSMYRWVEKLASMPPERKIRTNRETYRYMMDAALPYRSHLLSRRSPSNAENGNNNDDGGGEDTGRFVETLFRTMLYSPDPDAAPNVDDFHRVMHACIYFKGDVVSAERYFDELIRLYDSTASLSGDNEDGSRFLPTNRTYGMIIGAWAKQGSPRRATAWLLRMIDDGLVVPEKFNFETCLNAWLKRCGSGSKEDAVLAGQRAELVLLKMKELHERHGYDVKPTIRHIGKVVATWSAAASKHDGAAARAEAVLRLMEHFETIDGQEDDRQQYCKALSDAFLNVIRAYSLGSSRGNKETPEKCQSLFDELLSAAGGLQNIPIPTLRKLCSCIVLSWARCRRKDSAERAEATLHRIQRDCRNVGVKLSPDRFCHNSILEAWSQRGDGERAEAIWNDMYRTPANSRRSRGALKRPDTKSMNLLILAWSRSVHREDTKDPNRSRSRAEEIFVEMTNRHSIQPDVVTYNALLSALSGSTDANTALRGEEYLRQLSDLYDSSGAKSCQPNVVTYNTAIRLWSNISSNEAATRAQKLLSEMELRNLQPNDETLKALATVVEKNGQPGKLGQGRQLRVQPGRQRLPPK